MATWRRSRSSNPVVELDGDEMTRIIWQFIKDAVDPAVPRHRARSTSTSASSTATPPTTRSPIDAANAIKEHGVGVKCATITPDEARVEEFGLKKMWKSPNGTIRNILGGVVFREPIICSNIPRLVPGWTKPIVIGRHAHGDQYRASDFRVPGPGTRHDHAGCPTATGEPIEMEVAKFTGGGIAMGMYNFDDSIRDFARASLRYGLQPQLPGVPVDQEHDPQGLRRPVQGPVPGGVRCRVQGRRSTPQGLTYEHRLIDDMVAQALKWEGGYLWACKNYDGDVQSDIVAQGFGSLGLMT